MQNYIDELMEISTELAIGTQSRANIAMRIDELVAQMSEDNINSANPLGGSIDNYDIETEKELTQ